MEQKSKNLIENNEIILIVKDFQEDKSCVLTKLAAFFIKKYSKYIDDAENSNINGIFQT